jgi:peptide deformylase
MILPIYVYGNPVLRKVSEDITPSYAKFETILANLWETMYSSDGVGLAAPQIGLNIRLFVIDGSAMGEDDPSCVGFKKTFINAKILEQSGEKWAFNEGCLSLPTIREDVLRQAKIKIQYQDEKFETHVEEYDGLRARIIQHEYDHLEAKLFIDHINPLRKRLLKKRLENVERGNVDVSYKIKVHRK